MEAAEEFAKRFPGERIKSVSKARVTVSPDSGKGLRLSSGASVVVSKNFVALVFDTNMYKAAMLSLAMLSLLVAFLLLLFNQNMITYAAIILGLLVVAIAEAFLYMEQKQARMAVFDRASSEIAFDRETRLLRISGVPLGSEWLNERKSFDALIAEYAEDPAL